MDTVQVQGPRHGIEVRPADHGVSAADLPFQGPEKLGLVGFRHLAMYEDSDDYALTALYVPWKGRFEDGCGGG